MLADLTGERPSCYFEVGFAEALGLQVILIAQEGTEIHQSGFRHLSRTYRDFVELEAIVTQLLFSGSKLRAAAAG